MSQPCRLVSGGRIDRTKELQFKFDGLMYTGYAGDTLASALLANGVRLLGRSFKYHRPRVLIAAGSEEPNALIQLEEGEYTEPNTRATNIELYDGLIARSQNRWPTPSNPKAFQCSKPPKALPEATNSRSSPTTSVAGKGPQNISTKPASSLAASAFPRPKSPVT